MIRQRLAPLLAPGLTVVFVGTKPGLESPKRGHYYANSTNCFYDHLAASVFTPRRLRPEEDHLLINFGIGLDDVYDDPAELLRRLIDAAPKAVCFNNKEALRGFVGVERLGEWRGGSAARCVEFNSLAWALPDSSWNASKYWPEGLDLLLSLRERLRI